MKYVIISLLLISVAGHSYGQDTEIKKVKGVDHGPVRKTGCSNQKFIDAELEAYQGLLRARAEADKTLEEEITTLEQKKKEELLRLNSRYLQNLNECGNNNECTAEAKRENDKWVGLALIWHENALVVAQDKAYDAKQEAQEKYDEDVKETIKLYCHGYKATGQTADVVYSGVICSLEKPFTVIGTYPSMVIPFKFVPSSATAGTASYSSVQGPITVNGSGTYTIEGPGTDSPKIVWRVTMTMSGPRVSRTNSGVADINITLVPLSTAECDGQ